MADFADLASEREENDRRQALANFQRYADDVRAMHLHCVECGEEIPAERREAVPGCDLCLSCQDHFERNGGFWP